MYVRTIEHQCAINVKFFERAVPLSMHVRTIEPQFAIIVKFFERTVGLNVFI